MASHDSTSDGHGSSSYGSNTFKSVSQLHPRLPQVQKYLGCIDRIKIHNCETSNDCNDYAVSVVHRGVIVGHVLRHLSQGFSLFLDK